MLVAKQVDRNLNVDTMVKVRLGLLVMSNSFE